MPRVRGIARRGTIMGPLLNLIWDICCLRRGPQDLPYSPALLALLCAVWLGVQWGFAMLVGLDRSVLLDSVLPLLLNLAALWLLLMARNVANRFAQTATALIACSLLFLLLTVPLSLFASGTPHAGPATPLQMLLALIGLPLIVWKLVVDAHIFRHAINVPFLIALAIAVLWFVVEIALTSATSAPPAAAA